VQRLRSEDAPERLDWIAVHSAFDATVLPPDRAYWPNAYNIRVRGMGHHRLVYSRKVFELLLENIEAELEGAATRDRDHRPCEGTRPTRLDRFVAANFPAASRRRIRAASAALLLNGRRAPRSAIVHPGDRVAIPDDLTRPPDITPLPELELPVLYADASLVAVDKPAGISSVAAREGERQSAAAFLVARFPETRAAGSSPLEGGLVHRLDRDTSGLLLAARTPESYGELRRQFRAGEVLKEYLALVRGDLQRAGEVDVPIAHDSRHPSRMRLCPDPASQRQLRARLARTLYRPELRYGSCTLVRALARTGVRHQIRIHLASIGHPVIGDRIYGPRDVRPNPALALHATRICFFHPATGKPLRLESPLPPGRFPIPGRDR